MPDRWFSVGRFDYNGPVKIQFLSLVKITAFRLERKSSNFFLQINFPPMRALKFITGHVIFKLRYNQIYQLKTTFTYFINDDLLQ